MPNLPWSWWADSLLGPAAVTCGTLSKDVLLDNVSCLHVLDLMQSTSYIQMLSCVTEELSYLVSGSGTWRPNAKILWLSSSEAELLCPVPDTTKSHNITTDKKYWYSPQIIDTNSYLQNQLLLFQLQLSALQVQFHTGQFSLSFLLFKVKMHHYIHLSQLCPFQIKSWVSVLTSILSSRSRITLSFSRSSLRSSELWVPDPDWLVSSELESWDDVTRRIMMMMKPWITHC